MAIETLRQSTTVPDLSKPLIMAGPCCGESNQVGDATAQQAIDRDIPIVRFSLWKPRTRHPEGVYLGPGNDGIPWLINIAKTGLIPATEVLTAEHAISVIEAVKSESELRGRERLVVWLGARNQNDRIQYEIGEIAKDNPWLTVMIKNQMWPDMEHWLGIPEAIIRGGAREEQLLLCHRGFAPRVDGLRNPPDFEMAMAVKEETDLPMLIDISHIAGSVSKVTEVAEWAAAYHKQGIHFDGYVLEVHSNPQGAKTDQGQQLTWTQFDLVRERIERKLNNTKAA